MAVDLHSRRPVLGNVTGGLSGPAVKPVALRMVYQVVKALPGVPVIGIGGIMNAADALEFLLVGARAVQVGTANFVNPRTTVEIVAGIDRFLDKQGYDKVADFIGSLEQAGCR
jgi:dihydroorotate dehydrogenase (NAD+) catalytic subunit